jgi:hypothetical protein
MTDTMWRLSVGYGPPSREDLEWLARVALQPWARRSWRMTQRAQAIIALAGAFKSARNVAKTMHIALDTYCGGRWRFERNRPPPADDPVRGLMHAVLTANAGEPPSVDVIRRSLAGLGPGAKSAASVRQQPCHPIVEPDDGEVRSAEFGQEGDRRCSGGG